MHVLTMMGDCTFRLVYRDNAES